MFTTYRHGRQRRARSQLPREVLTRIIGSANRDTLLICARVSRDFCADSQRVLYREIHLQPHTTQAFALLVAFLGRPELGAYTHTLFIQEAEVHPAEVLGTQPRDEDDDLVAGLIAYMSRLRRLIIRRHIPRKFTPKLRTAVMGALPTLHTFGFYGAEYMPPQVFGRASDLRDLWIYLDGLFGNLVSDGSAGAVTAYSAPVRLVSLVLVGMNQASGRKVLEAFLHPSSPIDLSTLQGLQVQTVYSLPGDVFRRLLGKCTDSLRHLDLMAGMIDRPLNLASLRSLESVTIRLIPLSSPMSDPCITHTADMLATTVAVKHVYITFMPFGNLNRDYKSIRTLGALLGRPIVTAGKTPLETLTLWVCTEERKPAAWMRRTETKIKENLRLYENLTGTATWVRWVEEPLASFSGMDILDPWTPI
ncbi:hypothetical protein EV715DRAFT_296269 [Schizophyllum commune]